MPLHTPSSFSTTIIIPPQLKTLKTPQKTLRNPNPTSLKLHLSSPSPQPPLLGLSLLTSSPSLADLASFSGYDFLLVSSPLQTLIPSILSTPTTTIPLSRDLLLPFPSSSSRDLLSIPNDADVAIILSITSLSQIGEIGEMEGVDAIQVDGMGMAADMGMLWDPGSRKVRERVREAERRVFETGKGLMGEVMEGDTAEGMKTRGYGLVVGSTDVELFRKAAAEDLARWRDAAGKVEEEEEELVEEVEDEAYWKIM